MCYSPLVCKSPKISLKFRKKSRYYWYNISHILRGSRKFCRGGGPDNVCACACVCVCVCYGPALESNWAQEIQLLLERDPY